MPPVSPRALTVTIRAPLRRGDVPGLVARTCALLEAEPAAALRCEVEGIAADAVALDALARLALATRRAGCHTYLYGASPELRALVRFAGLDEVLLLAPAAARARRRR
jgi:STAS domain-containing protein